MRLVSFALAVCFALLGNAARADSEASRLYGTWTLSKSFLFEACADCKQPRFPQVTPKGYMIISPEGRMMVLLQYPPPQLPPSKKGSVETAAKGGSISAYSGRYVIDKNTIVVTLDITSDPREDLHELAYGYELAGDSLTMTSSGPEPSKRPSEWTSKSARRIRAIWTLERPL